ncbi:MAG: phosphoenolpyruvate carboxylase, partial [Longimicrobiales bacterium]
LWARIRTDVTSAWQTKEQPTVRPSVADEREHVLFYLITVLYGVAPALHEVLEEALQEAFPDFDPATSPVADQPLVRFASWVGGDMDGNPNVDADSIRDALRRHRHLALNLYRSEAHSLGRQLSQSSSRVAWSKDIDAATERYRQVLPEVAAELPARDREMGYRALLNLITARLERTDTDDPTGFEGPAELVADLGAIESSLAEHGGVHAGMFAARRLRRRVETFGFHLATLDVRQDARVHREVLADLLGDPDWGTKSKEDRAAVLTDLLETDGATSLTPRTDRAKRAVAVFRAIRECRQRYGTDAVGPFIISMAEGVDDVLAVLVLATAAGCLDEDGTVPLDVAPLFETVPDLVGGGTTLGKLFSNAHYGPHLQLRGRRQVVMVGYSDSNKDGGITAARWSLQQAQHDMAAVAAETGVLLTVFHGRGGTVSRGGGKVHRAVAASPSDALSGRLRLTEQGEVIEAKYGLPSVALRNLERMLGSVALKMSGAEQKSERVPKTWNDIADTLASASRAAYRALVYDDPNFHPFFRTATPIDVIERMAIGSRPASRRKQAGIQDLRAIPWVFAWTQTRSTLPGWYGLGSGLEAAVAQHGQDQVAEALTTWPFLSALIDDVEMVLAKSDMGIASEYVQLAPEETHTVFDAMRDEFGKAVSWITTLKGSTAVLDADLTLQRAIRLRNPYVDPMSLLQVDLLHRWREGDRTDDDLLSALLATVQGIARGLKNTG